jgi:hypothetical protein
MISYFYFRALYIVTRGIIPCQPKQSCCFPACLASASSAGYPAFAEVPGGSSQTSDKGALLAHGCIPDRASKVKSLQRNHRNIDGLKLAGINYLSVFVVSDPSIGNEVEISSHYCASRGKTD